MTTRTKLTEPEPLAYDLRVAARLSGLSAATLRRRSAEGRLKTIRVGGKRLVCAASLRALLGMAEADTDRAA
jgi:predicted site-specific integrase-resolvase